MKLIVLPVQAWPSKFSCLTRAASSTVAESVPTTMTNTHRPSTTLNDHADSTQEDHRAVDTGVLSRAMFRFP